MRLGQEKSLEDILKAANRGDREEYVVFLQTVAHLVRALSRSRAPDLGPGVCEEIVQETLIAIDRKRHTWREDLAVLPWLHAVVHYKVLNALRARGRRFPTKFNQFEFHAAVPQMDPAEYRGEGRPSGRCDSDSIPNAQATKPDGLRFVKVPAPPNLAGNAVRKSQRVGWKRLANLWPGMVG